MPEWARGQALWAQLQAQVKMDPDEIFQQHKKTCALNEVFGHAGALGANPKPHKLAPTLMLSGRCILIVTRLPRDTACHRHACCAAMTVS